MSIKLLSLKGPTHDSDFQPQPQSAAATKFQCMGSNNLNRDMQVVVAVSVEQNFLIFCGRSFKVAVRVAVMYGQKRPNVSQSADICMLTNVCIDTNRKWNKFL